MVTKFRIMAIPDLRVSNGFEKSGKTLNLAHLTHYLTCPPACPVNYSIPMRYYIYSTTNSKMNLRLAL